MIQLKITINHPALCNNSMMRLLITIFFLFSWSICAMQPYNIVQLYEQALQEVEFLEAVREEQFLKIVLDEAQKELTFSAADNVQNENGKRAREDLPLAHDNKKRRLIHRCPDLSCSFTFEKLCHLLKHFDTKTKHPLLVIPCCYTGCLNFFSNKKKYAIHIQQDHQKKCPMVECAQKGLKNYRDIENHCIEYHGDKSLHFCKSEYCSKKFLLFNRYMWHKIKKHPEEFKKSKFVV